MNDLTSHTDFIVDQDIRNAKRLAAWALRWKDRFGVFPPSYKQDSEDDSEIDIYAKADAARLAVCFAEDLIALPNRSAEILVHPTLFNSMERHGNHGVRKISRHNRQRTPII